MMGWRRSAARKLRDTAVAASGFGRLTAFASYSGVAAVGAILGVVQAVWTARVLGADGIGVVGLVASLTAMVANFVDFRLSDLVAKQYFAVAESDRRGRAGVLVVAVVAAGFVAALIAALSVVAIRFAGPWFTATSIGAGWILAQAVAAGAAYWNSVAASALRLSRSVAAVGVALIAVEVVRFTIFMTLIGAGGLDGYFRAHWISAVAGSIALAAAAAAVWVLRDRLPLGNADLNASAAGLKFVSGWLLHGNLLGYAKMLHRGADVLFVGWWLDDRATGLYKLARSMSDKFYILFDVLNQTFAPRCYEILAAGDVQRYRTLAFAFLRNSAIVSAPILVLSALFARPVFDLVFAGRFAGAEVPFLILTIPVVLVVGVHLCAWPILVHHGRLKPYTALAFAGCAVQYGLSAGSFALGAQGPAAAAVGYLAYDLVLHLGLVAFLAQRLPMYVAGGDDRRPPSTRISDAERRDAHAA